MVIKNKISDLKSVLTFTVIVAGLGYFVDLFDITLFGVVRGTSLHDLGVESASLFKTGVLIYNAQMAGLMIGGLGWGILADKRGRLSVMMGSILFYSLANIANSFVWNVEGYLLCRFLGGVGLAGELGAAITLVAESLPKEKRGLGTTIVAMLGMLGIAAAALFGQMVPWRYAYAIGGAMGFALLTARLRIHESTLFQKPVAMSNRGNLKLLFTRGRFKKYLGCILIGVPVYFTTGALFTFAPELTKSATGTSAVSAATAILVGSFGLALGDLLSGLFSQYLGSRRRAIATMLMMGFALMWCYFGFERYTHTQESPMRTYVIYWLTFFIGICVGYWAVLITMSAELFGTNIRATVATTVPNFVRGSAIIAVSGVALVSAPIAGTICFLLALVCVFLIDETFARDLDYLEET